MKKTIRIITIILALSSLNAFADIPILGVDEAGQAQLSSMNEADYEQLITKEADVAAVAAEDNLVTASLAPKLTLKGIMVGLGASGNIGIGDFKFGAGVNQQFYFEIQKQ